jgi:lipopolysaccharide heptosyltransferase II
VPDTPLRLLIVMPSWVGDCCMATPTLRLIRDKLKGSFIGALVRPGIDQLLAGTDFFDELHVDRARGVMGPKLVANKLRPRRYDACLLLTNSFSTALIVRLAGIPRRIGYDRDARGLLLTERLAPPRRADGKWATIPAAEYYLNIAWEGLLAHAGAEPTTGRPAGKPKLSFMQLATTPEEEREADALLARAGVAADAPLALLNPGANDPAKRWPGERFAALADHLAGGHGLTVLLNGSPAEAELVAGIAGACRAARPVQLPAQGVNLGSLKALIRRSRLMVTNDTGPRFIGAAFGVPVVTLFGPTDHRWSTVPGRAPQVQILADPSLPEDQSANDHPGRCRIDRVGVEAVVRACDQVLGKAAEPPSMPTERGHAARS